MSIRFKLTMWYTALLAVLMIIFGTSLYTFLSVKLNGDVKNELKLQAYEIQRDIRYMKIMDNLTYTIPKLQGYKSTNTFIQAYVLRNGRLVPESNQNMPFYMDFSKQAQQIINYEESFYENVILFDEASDTSFELMAYYSPIYAAEQLVGVLQVSTPVEDLRTTLNNLEYFLWIIGFVTVLLSASIGWFMARKSLKPIDLIINAARGIQNGADLDQQIQYKGPNDEIGRLISTINNMLLRIRDAYGNLEEAYRMQRRFVSDASHELRTPLTTIRGNVELLEKMWRQAEEQQRVMKGETLSLSLEAMRDIAEEAERISRLVNDLLALARADAGHKIEKQPVAMLPLLEEVARRAQFIPKQAEWIIGNLRDADMVYVYGNRDYLQQLLFIFIENAFKYTLEGSVCLDVIRTDRQIGLRIADSGIGIEPDALPHIFERFYRADVSRGKTQGTGLGLSIAKWIIDEHSGSVEVSSLINQGTTFTIWLPILSTDSRLDYNETKAIEPENHEGMG